MNVFVLCTGRCGSTTFAKACSHISNFTAAHESRMATSGAGRLNYPARHIEVDNRLSWFLGRLDRAFGRDAFYVHLTRNRREVAESFAARRDLGIMQAYRAAISPAPDGAPDVSVALDLVDTVTANIEHFLRDKPNRMTIDISIAAESFPEFWAAIGAQGDIKSALQEFLVRHNASIRA